MNQLKCSRCSVLTASSDFCRNNKNKRGYSYVCNKCHAEYQRTVWYVKNRECQKQASRKWKKNNRVRILSVQYKIPQNEIQQAINKANGICEICRNEAKLQLDHCHSTNKLRGMICKNCNLTLGRLGDNMNSITKFVEYLKRNETVGSTPTPAPTL